MNQIAHGYDDMAYESVNIPADMDAVLKGDISPKAALKKALWALALGSMGLILAAIIITFSPFDSSVDTAGTLAGKTGSHSNILGRPGANIANWCLQMIGWAALPLAVLMIFAAARAVLRPRTGITRWDTARRSVHLLATVLFLSLFLAAFPLPRSWPFAVGIGGWLGDSIFLGLKNWLVGLGLKPALSGGFLAILTFIGLGYSFGRFVGIVGRDIAEALDAAGLLWAIFRVRLDQLIGFLRRKFDKNYLDPLQAHLRQEDMAGYAQRQSWVETPGQQDESSYSDEYEEPHHSAAPQMDTPIEPIYASETPSPAATRLKRARPVKPPKKALRRGKFVLPGVDLLKTPPPRISTVDEGALQKSAARLHEVLTDFGVRGEIGRVRPGPVVTLYEFEPAPGVKSARVINLADDIARSMEARSARVAVVPGRNAIGIELPNRRRETVFLRDMLASRDFKTSGALLPLALGEDIGGKPYFADLAKMPHLLVAGTTGSGKSVGINSMILSLMYSLPPEQCKFIMIDPKMLELSVYDGVPHLLTPVVTEPKKAVVALKWTVREMEKRYRNMAKLGVRSIGGFNEKVREAAKKGELMSRTVMTGYDKETGEPIYETEELEMEFMPFIVVVIDEMADLMMVAGKEIEGAVQRLAQMARAAGIHMIMATQRPSVDVITGTIKANFPTRISFSVSSKIDSRTILGEQGAEQLLGQGDMLYMASGRKPLRLHGPFVSDAEVEGIANFIKAQGAPTYLEDITVDKDEEAAAGGPGGNVSSGDEIFDKAVAIVAADRKCSTSYIQRRLSIGYNRAANIVERMEAEGMIGSAGPGGKREILLPEAQEF